VQIYGQKPYAAHIQSIWGAGRARHRSGGCAQRLGAATVNRPKGNLEGLNQAITLDTNDQLFTQQLQQRYVTYRMARAVRNQRHRRRHRRNAECAAPALVRGQAPELLAIQRVPAPYEIRWSTP